MNKRVVYLLVTLVVVSFLLMSCTDITESKQKHLPELPEMVYVEGGTFNPIEVFTVTISSFYIGKYEVSQSEWTSVMGTNPSSFNGNLNLPVEGVSWYDAIEYCNRLSIAEALTPCYSYGNYGTNPDDWHSGWNEDDGNHINVSCNWNADGYRLPTEMEWEFAARGGIPAQDAATFDDSWAGTDVESQLGDYAWYRVNSDSGTGRRTHPVGGKLPNELSLYDMSGNVWNWNWDIWSSYPSGSYDDPKGTDSGTRRVSRGGSWNHTAAYCNVAIRRIDTPKVRQGNVGFRVSKRIP